MPRIGCLTGPRTGPWPLRQRCDGLLGALFIGVEVTFQEPISKQSDAGKLWIRTSLILTPRPRSAQRTPSPARLNRPRIRATTGGGRGAGRCCRERQAMPRARALARAQRSLRGRARARRPPVRAERGSRRRRNRVPPAPPRFGRRSVRRRSPPAFAMSEPPHQRQPRKCPWPRAAAAGPLRSDRGARAPVPLDRAPHCARAAAAAGASSESFSGGVSTAVGRSRAETTWSGPASAWIRARICCVTSGCSRRKAVAF